MLNIKNVYATPDYNTSYIPMIESIGTEILVDVSSNNYSGDSLMLLKNIENGNYGYLCFGWGSCSGCDALQACKTYEELDELRNELADQIQWFNTKEEILEYLNKKDWEGSFIESSLYKPFLGKVKEYFI